MKVVICGLGNATHALVPLMASAGFNVHVLSRREFPGGEVEISTNTGLTGRATVGNDPSAIEDAEYIVMPLPSDAFAHYLSMMAPHLKPHHTLIVTPGQGRFLEAVQAVTEEPVEIVYLFPMPVNCRIVEPGRSVDVKAYKKNFMFTGDSDARAAELMVLFDAKKMVFREGGAVLADLMPINPVIHPARIYQLFLSQDSVPENPLFYEEMGHSDIYWMYAIQGELRKVARAHKVKIPDMFEFLSRFTYETDHSGPWEFFTQYSAYTGFRSPLLQREDGRWVLDKNSRYLTEDIDFGLKVWQDYASQAGIETPVIDAIVTRLESL
jgi:hypothetical protein